MSATVCTIGVPIDLGQARRGVDMGPSALRYAGLRSRLHELGRKVEDYGNVEIAERETLPPEGGMAYLPEVVKVCQRVYDIGREATAAGRLPVFLGGDHSIAVGTVGGVSAGRPCGLVWIDAHGDFNTPASSPSGNLHGMPLAALCGQGAPELVDLGRPGPKLEARDVMLIGVRDLDPEERVLIREAGIGVYTMREIDERGIAAVARESLSRLSHHESVHVSLDMDSLDPSEAPGVGTPVDGGISYREAHLLMEILAESGKIGSIDVVEINPILDRHNETARLAIGLLRSLLGATIL